VWTDWNTAQVYRQAGLPVGERILIPRHWKRLPPIASWWSSWKAGAGSWSLRRGRKEQAGSKSRMPWVSRASQRMPPIRDALELMKRQGQGVSEQQLAAAADDQAG
jgi:hypothetical protein